MTTGAMALVVSRVKWTVFATLTVRETVSENRLKAMCLEWLKFAAHVSGLKKDGLLWLMRIERGELGHRLHLHLLIAIPFNSLGYFVVPQGCVPIAHKMWGHGMTRFRRIEQWCDPAVAYALKDTSGEDEYEIGHKTARAAHVVYSKGLHRMLRDTSKVETATVGGMNQSDEHTGGVASLGLRDRESLAQARGE